MLVRTAGVVSVR